MGRLLSAARIVFAVVVAAVVLGFLVTPGSARPSDNQVIIAGQGVVEGLAAFGRGVVDVFGSL